MSWAAVAKTEAVKAPPTLAGGSHTRVSVIDANALITQHGLLSLALADKVVTTPEVLREVRDAQSRATLAALPFAIETQESADESIRAGKFARATGDIHALSTADIRLIALAHGLEVAAHGSGHLHDLPELPKVQKKKVHDAKQLPGWGVEGGEWAEIDRLNEEELAAAEAALMQGGGDAGASHICTAVQQLSLDDAEVTAAAVNAGDSNGEAPSGESEEDEQEGEWETAAKSASSKRRERRRVVRKAAWHARQQAAADAAAAEEGEQSEGEEEEGEEEDACSLASDDDATTATAAPAADEARHQQSGQPGQRDGDGSQQQRPFDSNISIITADFAMQNVIMQMGLRLVTPDGRRITRLSRWLVVGPDGSEQYGVRRKHILRGTRFSLPKPKGGRHHDLILREDQLLAKAHRLRAKKKEKEELDPFAPEYGEDTWHKAAGMHHGSKGAAALLAGWKNNPNERKHIATNRRRK
ncbi:hypothetical protein CHLNCDRAFT_138388 [Chlorella variabilis]|uniref:Ribonuclease PIN domain-containing protein n=1 Tax=Chlorella variabilis TaxID=554065 RepID=E1ZMY3_CHLVA|nr:hypothetical protein CHLNCDRAFT_138388 [Chlorella variabilis]EFN52880.1 hypothetical protein CHLNCDRAFT_138388 [Chlorella variabilis]|eukprot:XP_005844982.1 hypothetical protein CHLNCDRAFT_138388 [Chlorella variabilis]